MTTDYTMKTLSPTHLAPQTVVPGQSPGQTVPGSPGQPGELPHILPVPFPPPAPAPAASGVSPVVVVLVLVALWLFLRRR